MEKGTPQTDEQGPASAFRFPLSAVPTEGRLLGIDYGTRRLGLALSTLEQTIATPFDTYSRQGDERDAAYLKEVAAGNRVVGLVVGLPRHTGGEEGQKAREARTFAAWAATATGLPVALWDERYTTAAAHDVLDQAGVPGRRRREYLDRIAAQIILQSFLDQRGRQTSTAGPPGEAAPEADAP